MFKKLFCLLLLSLLLGCKAFYNPMFVSTEVPDGPPEFQAGWRDGCHTGLASKKSANASVYRPNFGSGIYQHDPVYQRAWASAFYSCYVIGNRATATGLFSGSPAD